MLWRTVGSPPVRRMPSNPNRDTDAGEALDLLEGQDLAARDPLHPLLRHAVRAAEVAAVGDGDAQVAHDAPNGSTRSRAPTSCIMSIVYGRLSDHHHDGDFGAGRDAVTVGHDGERVGQAVAASWWLPWAPTERTWQRPSFSNVAATRTR